MYGEVGPIVGVVHEWKDHTGNQQYDKSMDSFIRREGYRLWGNSPKPTAETSVEAHKLSRKLRRYHVIQT